MSNQVRVSGIVGASITDGPGFRYAIFVQGCSHHCPGCHNPHTHDPNGGHLQDVSEMIEAMGKDPMLSGVTLSGGEPFEQAGALLPIARAAREKGLELAAYTGYLYEQLLADNGDRRALLALCDVLIDGPYIDEKRNLDIRFKGSENQRIIDVPASMAAGKVILKEDGRWIAGEDPFTAGMRERV